MRARAVAGKPDLVDRAELAKRLGVGEATMNRWHRRSILPEPDIRLGTEDVWLWETVRDWAKTRRSSRSRHRTGPLPDVVDLHGLARRLDVAPHVATAWKQNGFLPEPDYRWQRTEGWLWETIRRWEATTSIVDTARAGESRWDEPRPVRISLIRALETEPEDVAPSLREDAPLPSPRAPLPVAAEEAGLPDPIHDMELLKDHFQAMAADLRAGDSRPDRLRRSAAPEEERGGSGAGRSTSQTTARG